MAFGKTKADMTEPERHATTANEQGNTITFTCPTCGYVRIMDKETGAMQLINPGNPEALHSGIAYPIGIDAEYPMS